MLQAVDRHGQERTVGVLATRLGIHRSNASRLAATLADRGFLERVPGSDAFRLGPEIGRLGMLAVASRDLVQGAQDSMARLAEATGETVVLSVLDNAEAVDVAQVTGRHRIGTRNWAGQRSPLHATSDGKVLLAFAEVDLAALPLPALTARTITDPARLRAELGEVRARGWAASRGEFEEGLRGVAVPIWDDNDRCVAALSVSGPEYRLVDEQLQVVVRLAQDAAEDIGVRLGRAAPP